MTSPRLCCLTSKKPKDKTFPSLPPFLLPLTSSSAPYYPPPQRRYGFSLHAWSSPVAAAAVLATTPLTPPLAFVAAPPPPRAASAATASVAPAFAARDSRLWRLDDAKSILRYFLTRAPLHLSHSDTLTHKTKQNTHSFLHIFTIFTHMAWAAPQHPNTRERGERGSESTRTCDASRGARRRG